MRRTAKPWLDSGLESDANLSWPSQDATLEFDLGTRSEVHVGVAFKQDADSRFEFSSRQMGPEAEMDPVAE